jgi:hypothetical protein
MKVEDTFTAGEQVKSVKKTPAAFELSFAPTAIEAVEVQLAATLPFCV